MRPDIVVAETREGQLWLGIIQAVEHLFVQAIVPEDAFEALDDRVAEAFTDQSNDSPPCSRLPTSESPGW